MGLHLMESVPTSHLLSLSDVVNWSTLLLVSFGREPSCVSLVKSFQITHNVMRVVSILSLVCEGKKKAAESGVIFN